MAKKKKRPRGWNFASFAKTEPERQRAAASKGGKKAHANGTAHEWTSEEARVAGRKGGLATGARLRN